MFKPSKNPFVAEMTKTHKKRHFNLTNLKALKIDGKRFCAWCTEGALHHGNQKYCSPICSASASAWARPQQEDGLGFLLFRQDYKCKGCAHDYLPLLTQIIEADQGRYSTMKRTDPKTEYVFWYYFKRLKYKVAEELRPEVDHIVPIFKGGSSLGLDNHQVICYTCHKKKTAQDLSKPKNTKPRVKKPRAEVEEGRGTVKLLETESASTLEVPDASPDSASINRS
jgi:hypothetical protein